jgi:peptide/nickel transport system substrate-binding protein
MKSMDRCFQDYLKGRISRREFIHYMLALGVSMSAIASMLSSPKAARAAETPKRGGRVRAAFTTARPEDTLDPAKALYTQDYARGFQIYNTLVKASENLTPEPELAESWDAKPGAKEWTFKIRKGVEFHNGKTLTAEDAVYSLSRHLGEDSKSPAKPLLSAIEEIKAQDKHTLYIRLKSPNADLPMILGEMHMHIIPDGFEDFDNAIGTGPFKLKVFKPGVRSITVRNPNYWREGLPYLDEVETFGIPDPVARVNALLSEDVDLMMELDPKLIPVIESAPNAQISRAKGGRLTLFAMLCDRPPFDNLDLRLAMKYLIDRENYLKAINRGYGEIAKDHPVCSVDPMYCADIPTRPYDPDKAKHHLKKAGLETFDFTLHASTAAGVTAVDGALVYQQSAAKGGVNLDVRREPVDGYWSTIWMKMPFSMSSWNLRPTADLMLSISYKSDAPWNETFWKREDFDKVLLEARAELDVAKRKEMYCTLMSMISEDGGVIIPVIPDTLDGISSKVKGLVPNPTGNLGGFRFSEAIWLDT